MVKDNRGLIVLLLIVGAIFIIPKLNIGTQSVSQLEIGQNVSCSGILMNKEPIDWRNMKNAMLTWTFDGLTAMDVGFPDSTIEWVWFINSEPREGCFQIEPDDPNHICYSISVTDVTKYQYANTCSDLFSDSNLFQQPTNMTPKMSIYGNKIYILEKTSSLSTPLLVWVWCSENEKVLVDVPIEYFNLDDKKVVQTYFNTFYSCQECVGEGSFCGGVAGINCCDGLTCKLSGSYPDAGGTCVKSKCLFVVSDFCVEWFHSVIGFIILWLLFRK